jgi:hypothetical protein
MTARSAASIASLCLAAASVACVSFLEIPVETPILARLDVTPFQRVLVAGFVAGGSKDVDANTETVRLLRSQLRTKSELKVIDADVLSMVDVVDKQHRDAGTPAPVVEKPAAPDATNSNLTISATHGDPKIKTEKDLQAYDEIFADVAYWKKLGEEYQSPLIITGSVLFTDVERSGIVAQPKETYDEMGRRVLTEERTYRDRKGFTLAPKFIFIDGRTGAQLYSESNHEETLYDASQNTPALSSYFELMDRLIPEFLNTLSSQKIKGTRILLK